MSIRGACIGTGKNAVHAPVVVDAVYGLDIEQHKSIKCRQENNKNKVMDILRNEMMP